MRVFLDTNVLVSAFVSRGLCADLLRCVLSEHHLVTSRLVRRELADVLRDKLDVSDEILGSALAVIEDCEVVSDPQAGHESSGSGLNDATILAAAIDAEVDVFVTGDHGLLSANQHAPIPVISPRHFWEMTRPDHPPETYPDLIRGENDNLVSEPGEHSVKEKSFSFALSIIRLCRELEANREYVISRQLMRSGTSIGAQIEEAGAAESRKDFLHKMAIASKEARESNYWLRLLDESEIDLGTDLKPYLQDSLELIRLLTAIVKTTGQSTRANTTLPTANGGTGPKTKN